MQRAALCCSVLVLFAVSLGLAKAEDKKETAKNSNVQRHHCHGTVTKIDSGKHTITIKTISNDDKAAKEQEKTFTLADNAKIMDSSGKEEKLDALKAGDAVCLTEKDGKVTKVREHAGAKIVKVDQKAGTVTVKMKEKNGKDVEKTFRLIEDAEYLDSTGRVAVLDIFRSGDDVLFIESDGKIEAMKKDEENQKTTKDEKKSS